MPRGLDDLEIDAADAANRRLRSELGDARPDNLRDQWLRASIADLRAIVRSFSPDDYALPPHFARILPPDELTTLRGLLERVRALNEECVGMRLGEAEMLVSSDGRHEEISAAMCSFYDRVLSLRLRRINSRDAGAPTRRFERIYNELLPGLDRILSLGPSVHPCCLSVAQDYAAWVLYASTWRPLVSFTPRVGGMEIAWRMDPAARPYCHQLLSLYRWHCEDDLPRLVRQLRELATPIEASARDEARQRLRTYAEDLAAMRPLLCRNYRSQRTIIALSPDWCVAWHWNIGSTVGNVLAAPDDRALIAGDHDHKHHLILMVDREGLLAQQEFPWRRSVDLPDSDAALAVNLMIIERLFARVFELYTRVDVSAVLARFNAAAVITREVDSTQDREDDNAVTAEEALALVAREPLGADRSDAPTTAPAQAPAVERRVRGMRFARLIGILRNLGCEVRAGKGSEVTVYRAGARIARLGHHLRNPELSPVLVRIVLGQLGIPVADFIARA